jgi:DNA-binding XRE family transcriptional regulator
VRPSDLAAAIRIRDDLRNGTARERRIASGASGADMARVLHVTPQAVFQWETDQCTPTVPHALAYGRALAAVERRAA